MFIIGGFCSYLILNPKRLEIIEHNKACEQINFDLEEQNLGLKKQQYELNNEIAVLQQEKISIHQSIEDSKQKAEDLAFYQISLIQEKIDRASEKISEDYQLAQEQAEKEYLNLLQENMKNFSITIEEKQNTLAALNDSISEAESKYALIIEQLLESLKEKEKINFYKLQLSVEDINEIQKLREIIPYLRNCEALNKIIWKTYYEKPFTDLIGRVVGNTNKIGIYKITNLDNQMSYIGQSVNIKERWRSHIKRGIGAETPTNNKLYNIMNKLGVENFSFEIIEECPREKLNEKEKYWISFFKSQEFGYNETKGNN